MKKIKGRIAFYEFRWDKSPIWRDEDLKFKALKGGTNVHPGQKIF